MATPRENAYGHAYALLAMADWRLGDTAAAREALSKAETLAPKEIPPNVADETGDAWIAWLYTRVTLDEATKLMQPLQARNDNSNKQ